MKNSIKGLKTFFILWSTQSFSQLGSAMTNFALTLWLYETTGSALGTALLSVCSYAPYVAMSIFAGALSDRWDKKAVMLVSDTLAACCTVTVLILLKTGMLCAWHLYVLNAVNGLMNTVQQPASDVALTLIVPKTQYQRTSGLRSLSQSLITILHPVLATAIYALAGMNAVIFTDLLTFAFAFLALLMLVRIPRAADPGEEKEPLIKSVRSGIDYLGRNRIILLLIMFLAAINFVASAFDAALPAFVLARENGNEQVLGVVTACAGIATLSGSFIVTVLPAPKSRIRVIYLTMLISLSIENFLLAFGKTPLLWCLGQLIGWLPVPIMNANLDVIFRSTIPVEMQGRVYSCRNTLQFFTIPVGFLFGGFAVDITEAFMLGEASPGVLHSLFGSGGGSGAAAVMFLLGVMGVSVCLLFRGSLKKYE